MEFFNRIITHYGWECTALAGVLLVMFGIQLYYYLFVYGRIPKYKDTRRPEILSETPPVSVVIPSSRKITPSWRRSCRSSSPRSTPTSKW